MTLPEAMAMTDGTGVSAPPVKFNTAFIQGTDQPADLDTFLQANSVLPGTYRVDIFVNRVLSGRRDITFVANPRNGTIEACLTLDMLGQFGMNVADIKGVPGSSDRCFDLVANVEFARVEYEPNRLRLNISIPQTMMQRSVRGYIAPELWDEGVSAGFVSYAFSAARRERQHRTQDQYYLGLRNGLNLGAWRLRNESSVVYGDNQPYRFRSNRTFLQRDITSLKSQLTLGETFTDSQVFDSVRFVGAMLSTDDSMLPDNERIYAPVIRGIAETNATVEVRQNGFMLFSGNVSPGPFEISDIYPSGSNGDLEVTVVEADGRRRVFTQAYASLPIMVPKHALRYSLAAGQYDGYEQGEDSPALASMTLIYGLTDRVTVAGGAQLTQGYQAANVGAGINTGVGAVSLDLTQSSSQQQGQTDNGQSLRLRYANTLAATHTTLAVAGYRYSTDTYRTLDEHLEEQQRLTFSGAGRAKDRLEINLTQTLPEQFASLSITGSEQRYWGDAGKTRQLYLSWNAAWRRLSYSLSLERNQTFERDGQRQSDNRIALTLSLPLGDDAGSSRAFFNAVRDRRGDYDLQAGLNGQVLGDRNTFYSLQAGRASGSSTSMFGRLNTATSYGRFDAGYGQGSDFRALSLGASGSVVVHGGGVNVGQPLGETFALVHVENVDGARLSNHSNVETSSNGYAVVPYAQPYRANWISLDTRQLGADIELENAVFQVVPRRGAIPVASFKTQIGRRVQFELLRPDGSRLPLGTSVEDESGNVLAAVDPTSRALVLSEKDAGELVLKGDDFACRARYQLPERDPQRAYDRLKVICQ
ncbi:MULTISPECIES: fimbria/pilus outer membrane usher protein [unclassified Pseudomonas]|uniref:fimbria/pilus outer membrane usher protein n=1 Tax=unclassified Pseudomonas TaxID=196821 RepID=UPI000D3CECBB|nr:MULTISPECIES: fimbria/pilus outer membrane usher protein [unclassified Pseudomonas]RAU49605.1 fimbrial biogenesis outer membrane usher protein [Pseudomonas sp. RIT 409]RAU55656.1 fimbrial biogenesis outer membrane usher protein [Pseudomonas sp. RIT 412]